MNIYWVYKKKPRKDVPDDTYDYIFSLAIYERDAKEKSERCIWHDGKYDEDFQPWDNKTIVDEGNDNPDYIIEALTGEQIEELLFIEKL